MTLTVSLTTLEKLSSLSSSALIRRTCTPTIREWEWRSVRSMDSCVLNWMLALCLLFTKSILKHLTRPWLKLLTMLALRFINQSAIASQKVCSMPLIREMKSFLMTLLLHQ